MTIQTGTLRRGIAAAMIGAAALIVNIGAA